MRPFFWRIVICVIPCLLAGWVTAKATVRYLNGEPGGFKLGVDLVGGTNLVYEIDMRKLEKGQFDSNKLAIALKRRIDPNDLYNIMIRPAGGEGRVEIILPTGGVYREQKAKEAWDGLVAEMEKKYGVKNLDVARGNIQELADRIHLDLAQKIWSKELFGTLKTWRAFVNGFWNKVPEQWPSLLDPVNWAAATPDPISTASALAELGAASPLAAVRPISALTSFAVETASRTIRSRTERVPVGDLREFVNVVERELGGGASGIEAWVKEQAWEQLLDRVQQRWPILKGKMVASDPLGKRPFGVALILPDSTEQLVGFVQSGGNLLAQGALASLDSIIGSNIALPGEKGKTEDAKTVSQFIEKNYGPSLQAITKEIQELYRASGRSRDLTREEVQRIKDLVAKVGSLEFRILANNVDDIKAIDAAKKLLESTDPAMQQELKDLQEKGLPPPGPRVKGKKEPAIFEITLRNNKSLVTYTWVELGPQERHALGLDNASAFDPKRNQVWLEMAKARAEGKAITLSDQRTTKSVPMLQGALFYSRKCEDRNLPEEERRQKAYEYFVLARDPEIDQRRPATLPLEERRTPKIGGNYLRSAYADIQNVRPAVSFTFNEEGANLFGDLTRKNVPSRGGPGGGPADTEVKRHLAIVLDGLIMSAPTINSEIRSAGQITGDFTKREVDSLVNILRAGQLPASLKPQPVSESTMGATLGQDTIRDGVTAVGLAFVAVLIFMIIYYRFAGMVASVALLANLLLTIGFMVGVQATFTLPGLAGLVLMLGMAVDANVLIYERIREERERGAGLALSIRNGYDRAFPTIIDTHLSSIFTAIVLYIVGNDQLKGFGVSLTAGLVISLFTSLYMTRLLFDFWLSKNWLHKLSMLKLLSKPDIDFMSMRAAFFAFTLVVSILGIVLFIGRLPNDLNIDFVGGTAYGGKLVTDLSVTELRDLVEEKNQKKWLEVASVKEEQGSDGTHFQIVYKDPDGRTSPPRSVTFANNVEPADELDKDGKVTASHSKEREKIVAGRAGHLPDPSVEQMFPSFETLARADATPYFTIRTSEKEPELVQASLDRLLRGKKRDKSGKEVGDVVPLMEKIYMFSEPLGPTGTKLRFYLAQPPKDFNPAADSQLPEAKRLPTAFASPSFIRTLLTRELLTTFNRKDKNDLPFHFDLIGEGKTQEGRYQVMRLKFSEPLKADALAKVDKALDKTSDEFQARPQPERLETFDSQLASETRFRALWAIIASWGAIAIYLWFRFGNWTFGLAAVLCLVHDLFFTIGIVAACHFVYASWFGQLLGLEDFKFDLPAVAALLTLVGYSVNDTIVVFDRIREVRGKNPDLTPQMINDSINQTLSRTLLTSFITWLVVFVLYVWGGPGVKLFAFVMVVGVVVGTYSSIYVASPLLLLFGEGTKPSTRGRQFQPQAESAPA